MITTEQVEKLKTMKKGKAIYNPAGKAAEYSEWACDFYVGCSHKCSYCYCRQGVLASQLGGDKPTLKKCFKNEDDALDIFRSELRENLTELQEKGLFFSFTTDPLQDHTLRLTTVACNEALRNDVPVKILTKNATNIKLFIRTLLAFNDSKKDKIAIGFTLTGHDELEPFASSNSERIKAMRWLKYFGFRTWASIEPIIDFRSSLNMIDETMEFCTLYKIGLESGKKYNKKECRDFIDTIVGLSQYWQFGFYLKDSILKGAGYKRWDNYTNSEGYEVGRDYNIFKMLDIIGYSRTPKLGID